MLLILIGVAVSALVVMLLLNERNGRKRTTQFIMDARRTAIRKETLRRYGLSQSNH